MGFSMSKCLGASILIWIAIAPSLSYGVITHDNDDFDISEPAYDNSGDYIWSDGTYFMSIYQVRKLFDFNWILRKTSILSKEEAENVNKWDEVPNSTWFTNRHGLKPMSQEALARGPGSGSPADGSWTVIKGKTLGINPGFVVKDSQGKLLFIKFDPSENPGMGTNADIIASRFLHAAGYHVPAYYMIQIDPDLLQLHPEATIPGKYKVKRKMTKEDIDEILAKAPRDKQGRIFGNASVGLEGIPKGPFNFMGIRKDDPNDTVLHENRRELRGLRVIMAWLNNHDSRRGNSLDMYVEENGKRFLKHYLMDFSGSLGSGNNIPKEKQQGHEYFFDPGIVSLSLGSMGVWIKPWEVKEPKLFPEIGLFDWETFHPEKWRGSYPNPAFEKMTLRDAFWGAKIVTAFTDEDIQTIVNEGYFPTPGAKEYLIQTLIHRRDMIGNFWFDTEKMNPLDNFTFESNFKGGLTLFFKDLAIERGYADPQLTRYRYRMGSRPSEITQETRITLSETNNEEWINIRTSRDLGKKWGKSMFILLGLEENGSIKIKEIKR